MPEISGAVGAADEWAGVAKLVDARDLKSLGGQPPCRFESCPRHFETRDRQHLGRSPRPADPVLTSPLQPFGAVPRLTGRRDRKSTRLNSSHVEISYAVFCLKKKKSTRPPHARKNKQRTTHNAT